MSLDIKKMGEVHTFSFKPYSNIREVVEKVLEDKPGWEGQLWYEDAAGSDLWTDACEELSVQDCVVVIAETPATNGAWAVSIDMPRAQEFIEGYLSDRFEEIQS